MVSDNDRYWIVRLTAFVIDTLICLIPALILYALVLKTIITPTTVSFGVKIVGATPGCGSYLLGPLTLGLIELVYFTVLDGFWRGTIGKQIMGLKTQMLDGSKAPVKKSLFRNLTKIYWPFLIPDWLISAISPLENRKRKYTDRMQGTAVVEVKKTSASGFILKLTNGLEKLKPKNKGKKNTDKVQENKVGGDPASSASGIKSVISKVLQLKIVYKLRYRACPNCGQRLKIGRPRFGPEKVVCGNCGETLETHLESWESQDAIQKTKQGLGELFAPSYVGAYWSLTGLAYAVLNIAFLAMVVVGLAFFFSGLFSFSVYNLALGLSELVVGCLFTMVYPLKHLQREIDGSANFTETGAAPTWFVGKGREWLRIWEYIIVILLALMIVVLIALGLTFLVARL